MKYTRLKELHKYGFNVPKLDLYNGNLEFLSHFSDEIILRSNYNKEDSINKSYAGIFKSIGPIEKNNLGEIVKAIDEIKNDASDKLKKLNGNIDDFKIIIQDYILTDLGGVIFVQNDKILIETSLGEGANKVVSGNTDFSIYLQDKVKITNGDDIIGGRILSELLKIIKNLKNIYNFPLDIEFGIKNDEIFIFQVRPITKDIFPNFYLCDSSNIGENFPGNSSNLTCSFVKKLYSDVYKSVALNSSIHFETVKKIEHIFDDLIIYKEGKIYYNLINWYKMLLLFPGNNKKAFDKMIGSNGNIKYINIDDIKNYIPNFLGKVKYILKVFYKIFKFPFELSKLENYLINFYDSFEKNDISILDLNDLLNLLETFMQNLSFRWYITIDNDFVLMKFSKKINLQEIRGMHSTKQLFALKDLANGKITIDNYKKDYGHRLGDELKLETLDINDNLEEFNRALVKYKDIEIIGEKINNKKFGFLNYFINNREKFRLYRSKNFSIARKIFTEIGKKLKERGLIQEISDIFDYNLADLKTLILSQSQILKKNSNIMLLGKSFSGKIYIMKDFHIPKISFDILVAENFDPGWLILIGGIKGIIIENGNMLSHISIISRELNIPLLIGANNITKGYNTGDMIEVDNNGKINLIKSV